MNRFLVGLFVVFPVLAIAAGESISVLKKAPEPRLRVPEATLVFPVRVVHVVDGDTLDVQVTLPIRVRLLDCWAREESEPGGSEATASLKKMALGKAGRMQIRLDGVSRTDELFTFGRILANVWVGNDGQSLSEQMVERGLATMEKRK